MLSSGKYLAVFAVTAFVSLPSNVYLFNHWMAAFLAALFFVPMLGARPRMEKSVLNAIFVGFYASAFVSLIVCLVYYYP